MAPAVCVPAIWRSIVSIASGHLLLDSFDSYGPGSSFVESRTPRAGEKSNMPQQDRHERQLAGGDSNRSMGFRILEGHGLRVGLPDVH
eukprot:430522-Rhodomonas_salina.3